MNYDSVKDADLNSKKKRITFEKFCLMSCTLHMHTHTTNDIGHSTHTHTIEALDDKIAN